MANLILPEYTSPADVGYSDYYGVLRRYNEQCHQALGERMSSTISGDIEYCVVTTGSDGRKESSPYTDIDLIAFSTDSVDLADFIDEETRTICHCETKRIGYNSMVCYDDDAGKVFPARLFDCNYLFGDDGFCELGARSLVSELSSDGKKITKRCARKRKEYRDVNKTGFQVYMGNEFQHFDIESGAIFYNPLNGQFGVKYGPVRAIQFRLAQDIVRFLRSEPNHKLLCEMPSNIEERMDYLLGAGLCNLSGNEFNDFVDCYKFFLWAYHISQIRFEEDGCSCTAVDPSELKERLDSVDSLTHKPILCFREI